jgi:DNA-binding IclR family transcriptional regulator
MKSLNKALDILELISKTGDEMSLSSISEQLNLNKTTVSRIISALVKRRYLKQREKRGKYFLGTIFFGFNGVLRSKIKIREIAVHHLVKLSKLVGESIVLTAWDGKEAVLAETIFTEPNQYKPLRVIPNEVYQAPLHCSAIGKIILADMTDEELEQYFKEENPQNFTLNTITDINDMKRHLKTVRRRGVAFDNEEYSIGVRSVSAGLRNHEGIIVGAIGVLGPSVRLTRFAMKKISPTVRDCALEISKELGYRG